MNGRKELRILGLGSAPFALFIDHNLFQVFLLVAITEVYDTIKYKPLRSIRAALYCLSWNICFQCLPSR